MSVEAVSRPSGSRWDRVEAQLCKPACFGSLLALLWFVISFAYADRGMPPNDEGALLTNAARVLRGAVYYRDLDAYPFPGATYLLALVMAIFGEQVNVARALAIAVSLAAVLALYAIALQLLDRRRAVAFGVCLLNLKFLAWPAFTAYMYSDVAFAFGCIAIALLMRADCATSGVERLLAGACVGAALCAKQNLGIYLALAAGTLLLVPQVAAAGGRRIEFSVRLRSCAAFALGTTLPVSFMFVYFAAHGVAGEMIESGLIRPFSAYLPDSSIGFLDPLRWWELGSLRETPGNPYFSGPFLLAMSGKLLPAEGAYPAFWIAAEIATRALYTSIPLAFGWVVFSGGLSLPLGTGAVPAPSIRFAAMAAAVTASAWPRTDFFHVISVYPLVLLLLFERVASRRGDRNANSAEAPAGLPIYERHRSRRGAIWFGRGALLFLLALTGSVSALHQSTHRYHLNLDRANLFISPFSGWVESIVDLARAELEPGDPLFVYGHEAAFYFLADRYSPWRFAQLYPGQVGEGAGRELADHLAAHPPSLIVRGLGGTPALDTYTPELLRWVLKNYAVDTRVFERYPPPVDYVPPRWLVAVLRRRGVLE